MWPALRARTSPLQARVSHSIRLFHRCNVSCNVKPRLHRGLKAPIPEPQDHRRSWFYTVYRFSNFAVIPFAAVYCIFFADFGHHEHVFSPARRWLEGQRNAFFSLSSEELDLARDKSNNVKPDTTSNDET